LHYDLILKNGNLVTPNETVKGDVAVGNGKIIKTGSLEQSDSADCIYDASDKFILPGIIDAHVHFRDPGLTEKEDFESGSIAAAFGGITTIADMPNVIPVTSTVERFNEKLKIAKEKSYIDFALFALLTDDNLDEMEKLKDAGAVGFKVFFGTSTGDIAAPSTPVLIRQMEKSVKLDLRIGFHCETSEINQFYTDLCKKNNDQKDGILLSQARPEISEVLAMNTVIFFAERTNAKIHIHHITSEKGALITAEAKQKKLNISAETCPHYLLFDESADESDAHKVYPPIRGSKHKLALWDAVTKRAIDIIASDHAPHTAAEKSLALWEAPAGLCGVETSVPLMLNEVNKGKLSLNDYVRIASEMPAKIWGMYPEKGNLLPGADADFTIVDMKMKKTISKSELHSKSKTSPYDGMEVQGCPVAAIVRGNFVMRDGKLTGIKGQGKHVKPNLSQS
jgi:dihydroorotase